MFYRIQLHIRCIGRHLAGIAREFYPYKTMNLLSTLKANARDLVVFLFIGLGFACLGGVCDYLANRFLSGGFFALVLPSISNYLQGFSKFIGASLTATFLWMLLWPLVSKTANNSFDVAFRALPADRQLYVYLALILGALIAAAICFS